MRDTVTDRSGSVSALDGPVRTLFERIAGPAAGEPPDLAAIAAALADLATDIEYLALWVSALGDTNGALPIHAPTRGPRLTMVHRPEGEMGAIHDHGTWVAACGVVGLETHRRYRIVGDGEAAHPEVAEARFLGPAQVTTMLPPDDLHDHGHLTGHGRPAHVLIMTGDDQTRYTRNEWDLATGRHRILRPGVGGRWLASEPMPDA
jgi:predicted metal-dependent enzyme (double-stranded beta helix superfamily)